MSSYITTKVFVILALSGMAATAAPDPAPAPNVIWIVFDALRSQNMTCYGYDRPTSPAMDSVAHRGVLFENQYSQASHTYLSAPSYLTGRYFPTFSLTTQLLNPFDAWRTPPPDEWLVGKILAARGFKTCMVTAHPWFGPGSRVHESFVHAYYLGPDVSGGAKAYANFDTLTEKALAWLDRRKPKNKPFFLYLHVMDTHWPHILSPPNDQWVPEDAPDKDDLARLPDKREYSETDQDVLRGLYDGGILQADTSLQILLDGLHARGLAENSILILGSDHGECLGEDGTTVQHPITAFNDEVMHVPLIMAGPGLPAGQRVTAMTENVDIIPTLLDLLNINTEARLDGESLMPLTRGEPAFGVERVIAKQHARGMNTTKNDYKLIVRTPDIKYRFEDHFQHLEMYATPDLLGQRRTIHDAAPVDNLPLWRDVQSHAMIPWRKWLKLPLTTPVDFEFVLRPELSTTPEAYVEESADYDDRWSLTREWLSASATENAGPVTFSFDVPNGAYNVSLIAVPGMTAAGGYGVSVTYRAQTDTQVHRIVVEGLDEESGPEYVPLGEYLVEDEKYTLTLEQGDPGYPAIARRVYFQPVDVGEAVVDSREREEAFDQLRALGYVD